jgi:hypothetical protein
MESLFKNKHSHTLTDSLERILIVGIKEKSDQLAKTGLGVKKNKVVNFTCAFGAGYKSNTLSENLTFLRA